MFRPVIWTDQIFRLVEHSNAYFTPLVKTASKPLLFNLISSSFLGRPNPDCPNWEAPSDKSAIHLDLSEDTKQALVLGEALYLLIFSCKQLC